VGATAFLAAAGGFEVGRGTAAVSYPSVSVTPDAPTKPATGNVYVTPAALHNMDLHFATAEVQPLVEIVRAPRVIALMTFAWRR
jgi:hypothetical protein